MSAILCARGPKVCTRTLLTFLRSHFLAFSLFHVLTSSLSHFSRSHLLTFSLFHFLVLTSSLLLSHFLTAHGFALSFSLPHDLTIWLSHCGTLPRSITSSPFLSRFCARSRSLALARAHPITFSLYWSLALSVLLFHIVTLAPSHF